MRSKKAILCLAFLLAVSFLAFNPTAGLAKTVNLRLAHSEPTANPRHDTSLFFAKRVGELTNGEVKIEVFPAGSLGTHQGCQQQLSMGVLGLLCHNGGAGLHLR